MTMASTDSLSTSQGFAWPAPMRYLDRTTLGSIDAAAFQGIQPYPFLEIPEILHRDAYHALTRDLPDPGMYARSFGRRRRYGQQSHDRFVLQYHPLRAIPETWREFVAELKGPAYRSFVAGLLGRDDFILHFHWHNTPRGCSVSPHCDADWKLGSHIFYLNTEADWRPEWGGETIALGGRAGADSRAAPRFEDFPVQIPARPYGNRSLLFRRDENSWHGVRALDCPLGALRRVFIVEFRKRSLINRARTALGF